MGREKGRELTPEEAKARLRLAAEQGDLLFRALYRPRDIVIALLALGFVAGMFPGLRRAVATGIAQAWAARQGFMPRRRGRR